MKVTIITSCYNRERTIEDSIRSVIIQKYPNIEYIIIDGASKDNSIKIINRFSDRIARIISEPDHGMYEAINKGLKIATGDIIGLLHSDDFLYSPDTIDHIVNCFLHTNADIVYGNGLFVDYHNTNKIVRNWMSGKYVPTKIARGWLPLHPTVYISQSWLHKSGLYDEGYKIAADSDWLIRSLYEMHPKVSYLNEYIVRMRMGGLSTDPQKVKQKWKEDIRVYRSHKIHPFFALFCKIFSKIPQFISAKLTRRKINNDNVMLL